jgi:hypothetical protein
MTRIPSHRAADAPGTSLGLAVFTACFLNYAATELDLPAGG